MTVADGMRTKPPEITPWQKLGYTMRWHLDRMPERVVERGVPPRWLGWRWVGAETVPDWFARRLSADPGAAGRYETVHAPSTSSNPLPCNVPDRDMLPGDAGWWGYSFRDVPRRRSGETFIATLPDCRIISFDDGAGDFHPAILTDDDRSLSLREVKFRPRHGEVMRRRMREPRPPMRLDKATWILERVYHNHSHWLTAHLPKLCLLKQRGELDGLVLPARRTRAMDASLAMLGIDPLDHPRYDPDRPLEVGELTLLGTDRFRPELLRPVRDALAVIPDHGPWRRVLISRERATRRRLLNEEALWPHLEAAGFEKVVMEDLSFEEQVRLMGETAVLLAPHGAGLTNMMFCAPGTHVVEIADLSFPNPNFYALASAMGHAYWLIGGDGIGAGDPLSKDMEVDITAVVDVLKRIGV